jgi:pimeloyl-ACP methyl ester carboxylesterase
MRHAWCGALGAAAAFGIAAIPAALRAATTQAPPVQLAPCRLQGWDRDVRCSRFEVYENRAAHRGRKIALRVVVVPATSAHPAPDPVFYFAGGPGGSAVAALEATGPRFWDALGRDRDLVFVDQRGTGESNPLVCDLYNNTSMAAAFGPIFALDRVRDCRKELEKIADLRCYTTADAIDDADDVRAALGYDKIDVYGGSYGSRAALVYVRRHSEHVRTATLLGVAPPEALLPLPFAKGFDHALDALCADCAADSSCHAAFPDPKADCDTILARLAHAPMVVTAGNPFTGSTETVTVTLASFRELTRLLLYSSDTARWLPLVLRHGVDGDYSLFVSVGYQVFRGIESRIARGLSFSVLCSEDVTAIKPEAAAREMAGSRYGAARWVALHDACSCWTRGRVPKDFAAPVESKVPMLLLSGDADPVAPAWLAAAAVKHLPNARQVILPHAGHSISGPCVDSLVTAFLARGSASDLDTSCVASLHRPLFVTADMLPGARPAAAVSASDSSAKTWNGVLNTGTTKLRLVLHLARRPDGTANGSIDSPDQGASGLAIDKIQWGADTLHFEMGLIGATYEGHARAGGAGFEGEWTQGGVHLPLAFDRAP